MIPVRLCEEHIDGVVIHDTLLPSVPRVGETVSIRISRRVEDSSYRVLAVDYLLELEEGHQVREDLTGVRVAVRSL